MISSVIFLSQNIKQSLVQLIRFAAFLWFDNVLLRTNSCTFLTLGNYNCENLWCLKLIPVKLGDSTRSSASVLSTPRRRRVEQFPVWLLRPSAVNAITAMRGSEERSVPTTTLSPFLSTREKHHCFIVRISKGKKNSRLGGKNRNNWRDVRHSFYLHQIMFSVFPSSSAFYKEVKDTFRKDVSAHTD